MTQAQWLRLTGRNPSALGPHTRLGSAFAEVWPKSFLHPVEQVSWVDCMIWLPRAGLRLPSEAQWEYGARGGTTTPWWTGAEKESLAGAANLADKYAQGHGAPNWIGHELWLDDGATLHAPVGSYRANPFGLHDVAGNVAEWCLDGAIGLSYANSPRWNPVAPWQHVLTRIYRGGHFSYSSLIARSAARNDIAPQSAHQMLGVRPAMEIRR